MFLAFCLLSRTSRPVCLHLSGCNSVILIYCPTQVASSLCSLTQLLPANLTVLHFLGRTFATLPLGESVVLKLSIPCLLYIYLFYLIFR